MASPTNTSFFNTSKFVPTFPNLPFSNYFWQSAMIPGVSTMEVPVSTPFSQTFRRGDHMNYDPLVCTVKVDEDLMVYEELYLWMLAITTPHSFDEFAKNPRFPFKSKIDLYQDCAMVLNTNANVPNLRLKFHYCHPVSLSPIMLSTTDTPDTVPTLEVTFRYDTFEIERTV